MPDNKTATESKIYRLALLDWEHAPMSVIKRELNVKYAHFSEMRKQPLYEETVQKLKDEWLKKVMNTPHMNELVRNIQYGTGIAITKLVNILSSPRTAAKDVISAARLIAMMDGRFMGTEAIDPEERKSLGRSGSEMATELRSLMARYNADKSKVQ